MPAPTIAALLDYETNYEDALASWLSNTLSNVKIYTPRTLLTATDGEELKTPRVTVAMQLTGTNPNQQGTRTTDSAIYDAHKLGQITLTCTVQRNNTSQSLGTLRGGVRKQMLQATAALNANTLPYYQTLILREGAAVPTIDAENDEIQCSLGYELQFAIKPDQWAAS